MHGVMGSELLAACVTSGDLSELGRLRRGRLRGLLAGAMVANCGSPSPCPSHSSR